MGTAITWVSECLDVKIANDGLTWSGTGCFIAVPTCQQWASKCYRWLICSNRRTNYLMNCRYRRAVQCRFGLHDNHRRRRSSTPRLRECYSRRVGVAARWTRPRLCRLGLRRRTTHSFPHRHTRRRRRTAAPGSNICITGAISSRLLYRINSLTPTVAVSSARPG